MKANELPRVYATDEDGNTTPRILDYVSLLETLDSSSVISTLRQDPTEQIKLPPLPNGAILVDLVRNSLDSRVVITGIVPPGKHLFTLGTDDSVTTHEFPLPWLAYRVVHSPDSGRTSSLALTVCSPDLAGEPDERTELYRWPFSNVYHTFGSTLEGVCWPGMSQLQHPTSRIADHIVRQFIGLPNNPEHYTKDLSPNAPVKHYRKFLALIEQSGGLEHDWLEPCAMTIQDLHDQQRRDS